MEQILETLNFPKIKIADMTAEIIVAVIAFIVIWLIIVGVRDVNRFILREYYYCATGLSKNAKLLLITDLHNKQFGRNNQVLWNAIDLIAPDLIIIAGDMITAGKGDNTPAYEFLRLLSSKYPVYYGNGNHETNLTVLAEKDHVPRAIEYEKAVAELPVRRLLNEKEYLSGLNLNLYGLELDWDFYKRFGKNELTVEYLDEKIGEPNPDAVNLVIAHNPEYFPVYADWGADLVVSGHLHGGIVKLPLVGGLISPRYRLFPRYDGGLFTDKKSTMIVSRGLGSHILPLRLFNPGELVVIHMRH
ncbi:MAG: metallophosphoesterase [Lachnospiraceae bacterium]|nr:metallophosphoesterase [Lachnospiraceae bacterium]